jgi:hypothetical protein
MKTHFKVSVVSVLFCLTCTSASASPTDPLWLKAVEITSRNKAWVAGTVAINADVFNDKGTPTDRSETVMRTFAGPDGKLETELIKSVKNGKDETEKDRKAFADRSKNRNGKGRSVSIGTDDNPFNPDVQDAVEAKNLGEARTIDGKECNMYGFTLKRKEGGNFEGTAALEVTSGAPVEVISTITPLPFGMKSMKTVMKFGVGPEGDGFLRELLVSGAGTFLFITRSMSSRIVLEDYWKMGGG